MKLLLLAILVASSAALPREASAGDGNKLMKECNAVIRFIDSEESKDKLGIGFCLGLMQGITNTNTLYEISTPKQALFCLPKNGIQNGQAAQVVVRYLRDHPEQLHEEDTFLAIRAFRAAFPCPN